MSTRIDLTFARLRDAGQKAFVAYITAGDPDLDTTVRLAAELDRAGVDILELGVPFSDPLADGIVNQMAAARAIESGTTLPGIFNAVRRLRQTSQIPVVLFTYLNPLYNYGFAKFHADAADAGVDGVLVLDLPPDEAQRNAELQPGPGLARIQLIAPTTPPERIPRIAQAGSGFLYYVSREGVTGAQTSVSGGIAERVALIREATDLPIVVGFGISDPAQAEEVARCADGVVVGSAIVDRIAKTGPGTDPVPGVVQFVAPLVAATKRAGC